MSAHWLLAAGFVGMAVAIFWLGWASRIMWREWKDDRALRAAEARYERHTHRKGDALPTAGRIPLERLADPEPLPWESEIMAPLPNSAWRFAGESEQGWASESAEYELLTQTTEQPAVPGVDTPSDYIEDMTERVNAMVAEWEARGNYDRHTIQASDG